MRTRSSTRSACLDSCRCPAVTSAASGTPLPSLTRWTFVPKPPRERPKAWSSGSPGGRIFFRRPGGRAGGAAVGAIDAQPGLVDQPRLVEPPLAVLDDAVEPAALAQLSEAVVDVLPGAEAFGQV